MQTWFSGLHIIHVNVHGYVGDMYRDSMTEACGRCLLSCIRLLILDLYEEWISYVMLYLTCFTDMI